MKPIFTDAAPKPIGPYSQAMLAGNLLYCSGQLALDPQTGEFAGGNIQEQTELSIRNIEAVLRAAGADFNNVVKTTCFLTTMEHFADFNTVYAQYFTSNPARSCVAVKELPKGALIEIEVIAALDV
ncbi:MAG: RidA family protein [Christensenellales bacterium]